MIFFKILFDVSLFQINGILNDYSKILDLIFVNDKENCFIKRCDPISTPEDRFHPTIELNNYVLAEVTKNIVIKSFASIVWITINSIIYY